MLEAWSRVQTLLLLLLLLLVELILWNEVYVGSGSELLRGEVGVLCGQVPNDHGRGESSLYSKQSPCPMPHGDSSNQVCVSQSFT